MYKKCMCMAAVCVTLALAGSAGAQPGQGFVFFEYWENIGAGTLVSDLTGNPSYPDSPTGMEWRNEFMSRVDWNDNAGTRARALLTPPETGEYTFWVAGDDECQLWLSTDADPANATMIAQVTGWTPAQDWFGAAGAPGPNQKSALIALEAGQKYYIEGLMKEGGGGDSLGVAWGGPGIGDGPTVIAGQYLEVPEALVPLVFQAKSPKPADGAVDVTSPLMEWTAGQDAVNHDIYFGTTPVLGEADYKNTMPVGMYYHLDPLVPGMTYYWRIDEVDAAGAKTEGNVWSFTVMPLEAHAPVPANGALLPGSAPPTALSWTAGQNAVSHDVYLGTDLAAVSAGDASVAVSMGQAETSFAGDPSILQPLTTYYWRVDEHDAAGTVSVGPVWSFRLTDKNSDMNTENWAMALSIAEPKYFATYVADGVYDIGAFGGEQTFEFIVRSNPDETQASMCLIGRRDFGDTKAGLKYEQWNNTGTYGATIFGVMDYDFGVATAPGEYTHLVFVSSAAGATTDLYVNGEFAGSVAAAITLSGPVGIGYGAQDRPPAAPFFDDFDGDIFGVAIYDRLLTADEIAGNADKYFNPIAITDPDLLIYFDFEAGEGDIVVDQSGHSNHALFYGQPQWVTGLLGGCLSLTSATGDYIETTAPLGIVTNTVTVSGWVKHEVAPTAWSGILTHRGTSPGCLGLQQNGTELRYMWGADQYWSFSSGLLIPNGEWYFAAVAISPTQGKLYLNGISQTATNVAAHVPTNLDGLISVGRDIGFGTDRLMNTLIDDVRFYQKTLTDVDIQRMLLSDVTAPGDAIQGVPNDGDWPGAEHPALGIDDDVNTKFLHFKGGQLPTGIQVTPSIGMTIVTGLTFTTANDDYGRDPVKFELSGSNDGIDGPYTLIAAGDVVDFAQVDLWPRFTRNATAIAFDNAVPYKHYQVLFTGLRDPAASTLMQIADIELLGVVTAENLLTNGGFEDGVAAPWNVYGNCTTEVVTELVDAAVPEAVAEGAFCLYVDVAAGAANFWDVGLQPTPIVYQAGKKYTFSAFLKAKQGTVEINMKPELAADPWTAFGEKMVTATDQWQEFSVTTPVFETDVAPAGFTFHIGSALGGFWIDGVRFYEGDYVAP